MRSGAQKAFDGPVPAPVLAAMNRKASNPPPGGSSWKVTVLYGVPRFGFGKDPPGNPEPIGRALVARLGDDQFLVTGFHCRVDFQPSGPAATKQREYLRVEEGSYEKGVSSHFASGTATRPNGA